MNALAPSRLGSLPALVAVVVLGIIGMHAVGLHGSQHPDHGGVAASAMPELPALAGHDAIAVPHGPGHGAEAGHGEVAAVVSPLDGGRAMAGMAILCMAVLVGAALARMLMRARRCPRVPMRAALATSMRITRRTEARQTGPPVVWAFSVVRC